MFKGVKFHYFQLSEHTFPQRFKFWDSQTKRTIYGKGLFVRMLLQKLREPKSNKWSNSVNYSTCHSSSGNNINEHFWIIMNNWFTEKQHLAEKCHTLVSFLPDRAQLLTSLCPARLGVFSHNVRNTCGGAMCQALVSEPRTNQVWVCGGLCGPILTIVRKRNSKRNKRSFALLGQVFA